MYFTILKSVDRVKVKSYCYILIQTVVFYKSFQTIFQYDGNGWNNSLRSPEEVKTAHYHDDETHIRTLLELGGLQPKGGMALAAATVRGLILTISHQEQIGVLYPQVLETLVRGACRELFA